MVENHEIVKTLSYCFVHVTQHRARLSIDVMFSVIMELRDITLEFVLHLSYTAHTLLERFNALF